MKIECPNCQEDNEIDFAENISCRKCEKSFKGFKFSKRKLISVSTALAFGALSGYTVNNAIDESRYPLETEYALVDTCINSSKNTLTRSQYKHKKEVCLCALTATFKDMSYSTYKSDHETFILELKKNANKCS